MTKLKNGFKGIAERVRKDLEDKVELGRKNLTVTFLDNFLIDGSIRVWSGATAVNTYVSFGSYQTTPYPVVQPVDWRNSRGTYLDKSEVFSEVFSPLVFDVDMDTQGAYGVNYVTNNTLSNVFSGFADKDWPIAVEKTIMDGVDFSSPKRRNS